MSKKNIDVRGLACPEPLLVFNQAAKEADLDEIVISFDCAAARDNISRAAPGLGWELKAVDEGPEYTVMSLVKKA